MKWRIWKCEDESGFLTLPETRHPKDMGESAILIHEWEPADDKPETAFEEAEQWLYSEPNGYVWN